MLWAVPGSPDMLEKRVIFFVLNKNASKSMWKKEQTRTGNRYMTYD
jgi:hypothetical protein